MGTGQSRTKYLSSDKLHGVGPFHQPHEESLLLGKNQPPPADWCYLGYAIFFLHGIGHLLPWNFFITAKLYFETKFTCPSQHGNHSHHSLPCQGFESTFENWFSVASMVPIFSMSAANVWLQSKVHYRKRMVMSLLVMLVLFIFTTGIVKANVSNWVDGFFAITLVTVFLMNISSSVFQSSTFGFAGVLPSKYTSVVMSGQAVAGVFAALASILSQKVASSAHGGTRSTTTVENSAIGYFSIACIVIIFCLFSFFALDRMPFIHYYLELTSVKQQKRKQQKAVQASVQAHRVIVSPPYLSILGKVWVYALSVFLVFSVTISVYPAVLSQVQASTTQPGASVWTSTYYSPIVCFLMFNVSDLIGRYITHWIKIGHQRPVLVLLCSLRALFIPAFLFCNVRIDSLRSPPTYPLVPTYDIIPIALVTLFGFSNGYLGSIAMIHAPQNVRGDEKETASTIMAFFLSGGLLVGGGLSFLWTDLIKV